MRGLTERFENSQLLQIEEEEEKQINDTLRTNSVIHGQVNFRFRRGGPRRNFLDQSWQEMTLNELIREANLDRIRTTSNNALDSLREQRASSRFRNLFRTFDEQMGTDIIREGVRSQILKEWESEIREFEEKGGLDSMEKMFLSKDYRSFVTSIYRITVIEVWSNSSFNGFEDQ